MLLPTISGCERDRERQKSLPSMESKISHNTIYVVGHFQIIPRKQRVSPIYNTCSHMKCRVQSQFMFLEIDTITGRFRNMCLPCDFPTFVVCRELFFLYVVFHKDRGELCCGEEQGVLNKLKLPLQRSSWVREERE